MGWLTVLWLVPAVAAAGVVAIPSSRAETAKWVGMAAAMITLGIAGGLAAAFDTSPGAARYQFTESHSWIPTFGAGYDLGLDGIGLVMVLLTAALLPLLLLAAWNDADQSSSSPVELSPAEVRGGTSRIGGVQTYVALILTVEAMVLMSFVALDILLFYIFFEAMLIPMYFLIGGFGRTGLVWTTERVGSLRPRVRKEDGDSGADRDPTHVTGGFGGTANRSAAALKFLLYNLFGGLIMLAAVVGLYMVTARSDIGGTFSLPAIADAAAAGELDAGSGLLKMLFLGFMFAFAVKAPLWPFHTWLPDAAVAATPATAVLMMAIVDKVGTFAMLRFCLQLFPDASSYFAPVIAALAVVGILYGAILAIGQTDVLRLIAYTSISHFGFIILGIFAMTSQSQAGATLYMVNHGISTAALFLIAGFLVSRRGSRLIADFGGVQKVAPVLAGTFLVAGLATLSLPGLAPFISEFLVLIGTYERFPIAAVAATGALVLAAIYILWTYQRMMGGPVRVPDVPAREGPGTHRDPARTMRDMLPTEKLVIVPMLVALVALGVYPKPVLDAVTPAVQHTITLTEPGGQR
ncbi:NADH-quinone oxidoreductase subunit M [Gordonia pseudamarae]|jgi:NADH-quinone oxidoreductase subunit M|uniref:NADH-quinone oxidoreductase subunit M n=1 Tax=Gordonia pseudamarae TaxID=2831662 RepID=A0ABX6IM33_9ACTN|nr:MULTISPECIES: NADH-quinone oxidoreductase subunit M [Gordonia]MBD0023831.1 NADH-quinone oxidoreductase subunit M [Gordonia sp. (in: high G+C Gram-positive bacteria)]QHN28134.1 NADH-quinone oxidoreductase subunit M [Gordonia pseudamarae]QHN36997.1 NADH-quinone oxidoreductase subunit M [Gordonia pseudamarae]